MRYSSEAEFVAKLRPHLDSIWGPGLIIYNEVPCHGQARMDLLILAGAELIAVEAKLSHWDRLLAQAYLHRYCVDRTYAAIPAAMLTEDRLQEANSLQVGVIVVSEFTASVAVEARKTEPCVEIRNRLADIASSMVN